MRDILERDPGLTAAIKRQLRRDGWSPPGKPRHEIEEENHRLRAWAHQPRHGIRVTARAAVMPTHSWQLLLEATGPVGPEPVASVVHEMGSAYSLRGYHRPGASPAQNMEELARYLSHHARHAWDELGQQVLPNAVEAIATNLYRPDGHPDYHALGMRAPLWLPLVEGLPASYSY